MQLLEVQQAAQGQPGIEHRQAAGIGGHADRCLHHARGDDPAGAFGPGGCWPDQCGYREDGARQTRGDPSRADLIGTALKGAEQISRDKPDSDPTGADQIRAAPRGPGLIDLSPTDPAQHGPAQSGQHRTDRPQGGIAARRPSPAQGGQKYALRLIPNSMLGPIWANCGTPSSSVTV